MDLINSIKIELDLDRPENEARSTSQSLCDEQVLPALERVMRRFEDVDIVIEEPLIIELGDVPEGQLSHAVEDAFYRELAKRRREAVTPYETARHQVKKPLSEVFLEYLQYPVLPWDADDVKQFDEQGMMLETARKALSSDEYLERLTALVEGDVEACKRFFDLPWTKEEMTPVLKRMLHEIPTLQGQVYSRLLRLLGDDREVKPSLVREVLSYVMSGVLFGNRHDAVNCEVIATLLVIAKEGRDVSQVQPEAMPSVMSGFKPITRAHAERQLASSQTKMPYYETIDEPATKPKEGRETSSTVETNDAIAEKREALKQGLAHDEGMRDRLLRLIHLVRLVLNGEASFSHCIVEMEALVESLWEVVPLTWEKEGNHLSGYSQTLSDGPVEVVLTETTTISASKRLDGSPSSEETLTETVTAVALELQEDSMPLEETSVTTATTEATRHLDYSPTLAEESSETTTAATLSRADGVSSSLDSNVETANVSTSERPDTTPLSRETSPETTSTAITRQTADILSSEEASAEMTTTTTSRQSDGTSSSEEVSIEEVADSSSRRTDGSSSWEETLAEAAAVATQSRQESASSTEEALTEAANTLTPSGQGRLPSEKETPTETATTSTSKPLSNAPPLEKTTVEKVSVSTMKHLDGSPSSEEISDEKTVVPPMKRPNGSASEESFAETTSASMGTKSVSLMEEDVVDIIASLSVRHDAESKRGGSQADKARLQEVVATAIRKQPNIEKRIPVHNAGLVLFQPFLVSFFDRLGLLESRKGFKSLESQLRAAHLLHELSGFGGEHLEHLLPLNKLLCGINIMFPIGTTFDVTEEEQRETDALLTAVIRNWSAIGKASPAGFQEAFVRREGLLERSQDEWILRVESKGIDVLLDYIPWDIHTVSLPWNDYLIFVDWKV